MVIDRSEQELLPVMPSEEAIAALSLDPAKPILEKVSRGFLKDGRVFEFSRNVFNSDDYNFTLVAKRRH
jgi:GntR family mannosyl-D-glycerate transport/metabolism transcriptional repressor